MNQEKPVFSQEQIMSGINSLSEQLRDELGTEMSLAKLKPGEDPAQSHQQRVKAAALNMTRFVIPGETPDQTQKRMDTEAERIISTGEERVAKISGYLKMLVDFEKAFKEHGAERELRASPESAARIKSLLAEMGPLLISRVENLTNTLSIGGDYSAAERDKRELAKAQSKLAALKKLAASADLEF